MTPSRCAQLAAGDPDALPSHPTSEQSAILGPEQIFPSNEEDEDKTHAREVSSWSELAWWRRPSPYWPIFGTTLGAIAFSATVGPKVAIYTDLACRVHRPEYVSNNHYSFAFPLTRGSVTTDVPTPRVLGGDGAAVTISPLNSPYIAISFENELDFEQKCASDPVVQAAVARLSAVLMTATGVLSCLTSGWWGSLSDRFGRRVVILASVSGGLISDLIHIITARFVDVLPGGYWFLLVGYLIEGLCGSLSARTATTSAYISDTTMPSTRSRYFALSTGFMFVGVAIGPLLGGLLIRSIGSVLSVFYLAGALHTLFAIFVLCVPESLTSARARGARLRRAQEKVNEALSGHTAHVFSGLKSVTRLFSPLRVLLPESSSDTNSLKRDREDYNLFFTAMAYGLLMSVLGSLSYKYQYAAAQFSWTPEETSYYISIVGASRATFLTIILPLVIKYLKPSPIQLSSRSNEPLESDVGSASSRNISLSSSPAQAVVPDQHLFLHSAAFDLTLVRVSSVLEIASFLGMAAASTGGFFTLASVINSFGSGSHPVTQALALHIYTSRHPQACGEAGKLFGALSVIQAFGPAMYGFIYFNTVAVFPQGIIIMSMCTTSLAFVFLLFVRIPSRTVSNRPKFANVNEGGQEMDVETPEILIAIEHEDAQGR